MYVCMYACLHTHVPTLLSSSHMFHTCFQSFRVKVTELFTATELINLPWIDSSPSMLWHTCMTLSALLLSGMVDASEAAGPPRLTIDVIDPRDPATLTPEERKFDFRWIRNAVVLNQYHRLDEFAEDVANTADGSDSPSW